MAPNNQSLSLNYYLAEEECMTGEKILIGNRFGTSVSKTWDSYKSRPSEKKKKTLSAKEISTHRTVLIVPVYQKA